MGEGLSRNAVIKQIWGVTGGKGYQKKAAYLDSVLVKYALGWVRELLTTTEATHKAILLHVFLCQETDRQRIQKYAPQFIKLLSEIGIEPDDSLNSIG